MSNVKVEVKNEIAYVTLDREEVLNTLDYPTLVDLEEAVEKIHLDPDVRIVIFTGAGEKAFCGGADLKERRTLTPDEVRRNVKKIADVFNDVENLPQPTIAAVNGFCFGGGFELMLACDLVIASDNSKFGLTETGWGIIPGAGGTQRLPRAIGAMKAKELILTARRFDVEEAKELGLVLDVVSQEELMGACEELAERIKKNAPISVRQAKYAINAGLQTDVLTGVQIENRAYDVTIDTEDRIEALEAFAERRDPVFKGK